MSGSLPLPPSATAPRSQAVAVNVVAAKRLLEGVLGAPTPVHSTVKWVAPTIEELAPLFPKYNILRLIGRGGMGAVYMAIDPALNRQVAIKILPPYLAEQPGFQERFRREALTLAQLDHQNVVRIHEYGPTGATLSFVMDYVVGQNLAELLRQQRAAKIQGATPALSFSEIISIAGQICAGLQAAHEHGVIHRDIKPANIMVTSRGRVKVADFGLAREITPPDESSQITGEYEVMGTAEYMAPEVLSGGIPGPQSDVYSVGVVLYEMLTGEIPRGNFPPPSKKTPVHPRVDALVLKAMNHEAAQRFPDVASLAAALQRLHASDGKWSRWHRPLTIGATMVISGAAAALAWFPQHATPIAPLPAVTQDRPQAPSSAGLLYEESFDYPVGKDKLPGHGGYERKIPRGSASDIVPGSMVYVDKVGNQLLTKGNSAHVDAHQGSTQIDDITELHLPTDTPEVIWCSVLAQQTAGTTGRFITVAFRAPDNTAEPPDQGYTDDQILAIGLPSDALLQQWQIWDRSEITLRSLSVSDSSTTEVAFLLVKMELNVNDEGCERFTFWVNPRLDAPPPATKMFFISARSNVKRWTDLTKLRLGAGFDAQPGRSSGFLVDEIRLGTSAAAVMPIAPVKSENPPR